MMVLMCNHESTARAGSARRRPRRCGPSSGWRRTTCAVRSAAVQDLRASATEATPALVFQRKAAAAGAAGAVDRPLLPGRGADMPNTVTAKTLELTRELHRLAAETEPYLGFASREACAEWWALRATWPSLEELGQPTLPVSDAELEALQAKVRRFGELLRLAAAAAYSRPVLVRIPRPANAAGQSASG
jgi:hypothetical protein